MVIEDFRTLPVPEQWSELWGYGRFLASLYTPFCYYSLYGVHDFYVEVQSDPYSKKIIKSIPFKETELLEKYINGFQVTGFEKL